MDALPRHDFAHTAEEGPARLARLTAWLRSQQALDPFCDCLALAAVLILSRTMRFDAADPHWPDRDRLVVSPALRPLADLLARLAGAEEGFAVALPEPPGQSLGAALGMAIAERALAARFGRSLVDHRIWVLATPADLATGLAQEAATVAGSQRLGRLTVLTAMPEGDACPAGIAASWSVRRAGAGDESALQGAVSAALRSQKPTLIACLGPAAGHASTDDGLACGDDCAEAWRSVGGRGAAARRGWLRRLTRHAARDEFERTGAARLPSKWHSVFSEPGPLLSDGELAVSPMTTARRALTRLLPLVPELVILPNGGTPGDLPAASWHLHTQALATALGGMALHGGVLPIGHMRLSDAESLAAALRTAAQAGLRVIHVLGEPAAACPTAGYRAGLRAMRNVFVFRPADAAETLECAELAMRRVHGPSVLLLSETACAPMADRPTRTRCVHGGFVLREPEQPRHATLIASGAELATALAAHQALAEGGIATAVVSLPCWELFSNQEPAWRDQVLGPAPRIGIEAGSGFGWERWIGTAGAFIGSETEAGPGEITVERIVSAVTRLELPGRVPVS